MICKPETCGIGLALGRWRSADSAVDANFHRDLPAGELAGEDPNFMSFYALGRAWPPTCHSTRYCNLPIVRPLSTSLIST